jgi:hypothetical protein
MGVVIIISGSAAYAVASAGDRATPAPPDHSALAARPGHQAEVDALLDVEDNKSEGEKHP